MMQDKKPGSKAKECEALGQGTFGCYVNPDSECFPLFKIAKLPYRYVLWEHVLQWKNHCEKSRYGITTASVYMMSIGRDLHYMSAF